MHSIMPRLKARVLRPTLAVAALAALACDLPTSVPTWNTTWEVPAQSASLSVDEFLPAGVRADDNREVFLYSTAPIAFSRSLGSACAECAAVQGSTAPKPEFTLRLDDAASLPDRFRSAELAGGHLALRITNGLTFDPLRPGATERGGWLGVSITSGGRQVAVDTMRGTDWTLPANGGELVRRVPLSAGTVLRDLAISVTLYSPRGDAVRIDTAQRIAVVATVDTARIASAIITVQDQRVGSTPVTLDLDAVPGTAVSRVESGALQLDIANPFDVHSTTVGAERTQLVIDADGRQIRKDLAIAPGDTRVTLDFTGDELRTILGAGAVTLDVSGFVTAPGDVTVTPAQQIGIVSRLRFILRSTER